MAKPKKRRAKKRRAVDRAERHPATPETLAKIRPDLLDQLLRQGPENGGIDNQQFEALWAIRDAAHIVGRGLGYQAVDIGNVGHGNGEMSDADSRRWDIYTAWGRDFAHLTGLSPSVIRDWVDRDRIIRPADDLRYLVLAAKLWGRHASTYDKRREAEANAQNRVLTRAL